MFLGIEFMPGRAEHQVADFAQARESEQQDRAAQFEYAASRGSERQDHASEPRQQDIASLSEHAGPTALQRQGALDHDRAAALLVSVWRLLPARCFARHITAASPCMYSQIMMHIFMSAGQPISC